MKAKNGISLIVLVITIVVIIILAAAVILSLGDNNPINNSKIAQLTQTRDNIESAVQIYLSNEFAKCQGDFTAKQIIEGVGSGSLAGSNYTTEAIVTDEELDGYKKIDVAKAKTALNLNVPTTENQIWYLNPSTGKVKVKFTGNVPAYIYANGEEGELHSALGFVTK